MSFGCYLVMMSEEMLDTYDRDGNFLGVKSRHACHDEDTQSYHHVVCIWVLNDQGEILLQKRAADKESNPNQWDNACGGHVNAGESALQGCVREIGEELGMTTQPTDFHFLTDWVYPERRHFMHVYYLRTNLTPADLVLQAAEVAAVQYLPYAEFVKLFYSAAFVPGPAGYKDFICTQLRALSHQPD